MFYPNSGLCRLFSPLCILNWALLPEGISLLTPVKGPDGYSRIVVQCHKFSDEYLRDRISSLSLNEGVYRKSITSFELVAYFYGLWRKLEYLSVARQQ